MLKKTLEQNRFLCDVLNGPFSSIVLAANEYVEIKKIIQTRIFFLPRMSPTDGELFFRRWGGMKNIEKQKLLHGPKKTK